MVGGKSGGRGCSLLFLFFPYFYFRFLFMFDSSVCLDDEVISPWLEPLL